MRKQAKKPDQNRCNIKTGNSIKSAHNDPAGYVYVGKRAYCPICKKFMGRK